MRFQVLIFKHFAFTHVKKFKHVPNVHYVGYRVTNLKLVVSTPRLRKITQILYQFLWNVLLIKRALMVHI